MSKLIVNEIEKYGGGQLTITTGTNVSIGSNLTVGGTIAGSFSVSDITTAINSISATQLSDITSVGSGSIITTTERNKLSGIETGAEVNTVDSVNGATGTVVLDADDIDDTSTTNKFTNQTDIDKLAGIEALADVTDATNVAAAGALMDGVALLNDLADVSGTPTDKDLLTYNNTTGVWENSKTLGDITTGNITTSGTVDGVDISDFKNAYDSHTHTESEITDFGNYVTTLTHDTVNNKLVLTKRDATIEDVSLVQYLDDTNLARIVSGSINASTGIGTFTRDDSTTFNVDFSSLLGDVNDYVNSASFNSSNGVLTLTRFGGTNVTVDLDGRYLTDTAVSVISGSTTAVKNTLYVFTASLTLTLPASPSVGDTIKFSNLSGTTTPVIARNGNNIMGLAENLTIDVENFGGELIFTGSTKGWVIL
jgi:hypothetical protein